MSREWIGSQHLLHLCSQAVKAVTHTDRAAGQIDLGARHHLDHGVAFNTASTRRSARSLTKASTRKRTPSAESISIAPGRSAIPGRGKVSRHEDVPPTTADEGWRLAPGLHVTPIGMNAQCS